MTKAYLSVTGIFEAATGLVLLAAPVLAMKLLLGTVDVSPVALTVTRVAGVALLALGIACWLMRPHESEPASRALVAAMLVYNIGVVAILVLARTMMGLAGILFWPAVMAHGGLAAWFMVGLTRRSDIPT